MRSTLENQTTLLDPLTRLARIEAYGTDVIPTQDELDTQVNVSREPAQPGYVGAVAVVATQVAERHAA